MSPSFSSLNLVLLGPPGSGKGTQAALLSARFELPHISTGDMLRDEIERGSMVGRETQEKFLRGEPVSDHVVAARVLERLHADDCARGFILDGFPLNLEQAAMLDGVLAELGRGIERVVMLDVTEEELVRRCNGHQVVPGERLERFRLQAEPLMRWYRDREQLVVVDGNRGIEDVSKAVLEAIETPVAP